MPPTPKRTPQLDGGNTATFRPNWRSGVSGNMGAGAGQAPSQPSWLEALKQKASQRLGQLGTPSGLGGGSITPVMPSNTTGAFTQYNQPANYPVNTGMPAGYQQWWQNAMQPARQNDPALRNRPVVPGWMRPSPGPAYGGGYNPTAANPALQQRQDQQASLAETMGTPADQTFQSGGAMADLGGQIDDQLGMTEPWKPGWAREGATPPGQGSLPGHQDQRLRDYYAYLQAVMQQGEQAGGFGTDYGWGNRRGRGGGGYGGGGYGGSNYVPPAYLNLFSWNYGE